MPLSSGQRSSSENEKKRTPFNISKYRETQKRPIFNGSVMKKAEENWQEKYYGNWNSIKREVRSNRKSEPSRGSETPLTSERKTGFLPVLRSKTQKSS
jgi:hypothetical protein